MLRALYPLKDPQTPCNVDAIKHFSTWFTYGRAFASSRIDFVPRIWMPQLMQPIHCSPRNHMAALMTACCLALLWMEWSRWRNSARRERYYHWQTAMESDMDSIEPNCYSTGEVFADCHSESNSGPTFSWLYAYSTTPHRVTHLPHQVCRTGVLHVSDHDEFCSRLGRHRHADYQQI